MSVPSSLLPADAHTHVAHRTTGPAVDLDRVHDHVLRVLGDEEAAGRVVADVAARSSARARELGEAPTFERLVRLAHARLGSVSPPARPRDAVVARLAGDREPGGAPLVRALAATSPQGAALLDLTTRHDVDLRRAAEMVGLDRASAVRARTQALHEVRATLDEAGVVLDVTAVLARLPMVEAPHDVHRVAELPAETGRHRRVPAALAWVGTATVVLATVAGLIFGLPPLVAADTRGDAPVVMAEAVSEGPAARQLSTPGDDVPEGGVEKLVVRGPDSEPVAPTTESSEAPSPDPQPSPEPTPSPSPTEDASTPTPEGQEPADEPSPEPSPEPSEDPLERLLPTDS